MNAELVRQIFDYDRENGCLRWRITSRYRINIGDIAGSRTNGGYWKVMYKRRHYLAHRLIWLYVTRQWPVNEIDHIDGDTLNNRISNLRDVTHSVNRQNLKRADADSATGLLGVTPHHKKFRAQIKLNGQQQILGTFDTAHEAHVVYMAAKRQLHVGFVPCWDKG